jgi:hypothetical protein
MGDGGEDEILGFFEKGNHLAALYCRKAVEKFVNGITRLKLVH